MTFRPSSRIWVLLPQAIPGKNNPFPPPRLALAKWNAEVLSVYMLYLLVSTKPPSGFLYNPCTKKGRGPVGGDALFISSITLSNLTRSSFLDHQTFRGLILSPPLITLKAARGCILTLRALFHSAFNHEGLSLLKEFQHPLCSVDPLV